MNAADFELCALCPRLCRPVCPVAVGSAREAATPTQMMGGPLLHSLGVMDAEQAAALASLCTGCGACTAFCHYHRPVAALLADARGALAPAPDAAPIGAVEGRGDEVAIECDGRSWAGALAGRLGRPIARLATTDHLGEPLLDHTEAFAAHAQVLRDRLAGRTALVADHGCLRAARSAGLRVRHLSELVPARPAPLVFVPCQGPRPEGPTHPDALSCCGACAPLSVRHPDIASDVAAAAASRLGQAALWTPDARCGAALRSGGARVDDPVAVLLSSPPV